MEFNHSIPKTKHIHKTIPSLLFTAALLLCTALITPLTVHAGSSSTEVEAEHSDGTYTSSNGRWVATYAKDAGYKGQGVLLYLLERNGGGPVAGTTPKAYPCSAAMLSYELHAQDKYNRYPEVTTWESIGLYWANPTTQNPVTNSNGGFMKNSITSNTAAIKNWLKTPSSSGNSTQGIWMVQSIWGQAVAERFTNEEIILIAEPIVAIKFAQYYTSDILDGMDINTPPEMIKQKINNFYFEVSLVSATTAISPDLDDLLQHAIDNMDYIMASSLQHYVIETIIEGTLQDLQNLIQGTNIYWGLGDTYAGTPKMVAQYFNSLSGYSTSEWHKSDAGRAYYRKSANAAAYIPQGSIICSNANFNLLPATIPARQIHPDSNLQTYSIGMLAMLAFTSEDGQTTADESLIPTPHSAPDESDGTTTIIKSYRTRNTTTNTLTDDGTYTRSNLTNQITIEDEDTYKVIAWKTSTQNITNTANFSLTWETSIPGIIGDQGTTATSVTLPSGSQKYLYVLLEKSTAPTPATTNYTLPQSSITRHIYLSTPDAQLTMPQIQSHTFTWYIPAHPEGTCGGHPYNFHCVLFCTLDDAPLFRLNDGVSA